MTTAQWGRGIAIALGATVVFGLQAYFEQSPIVAVAAGIAVYFGVRGAFAALAEEKRNS